MSTSLAEQLQRLAVPQTTLLKRDKSRPSLLFDPREAAGLKKETVYQIGTEGLEELISKNAIFEQFTQTLFDVTSKSFERAVEGTKNNKKLDKHIRKFLLLLSPYFLLNCSHKALEWLIYRYHIHLYNRDSLLMLIMPYHESNIFVRVVQLMKFKDANDNWFFLKSLQKPGIHLSKQGLLTHAASSISFLKFVSKFMFMLLKEHTKPNLLMVAFNFYCTVYAGAIEFSKKINEAQVTQMLPSILKGLNSDIPDYCASCYVITARLVAKISLTNNILNTFVSKISEVKVDTLRNEAALALLVIYQNQKHYDDVPEDACRNLAQKQWLPKVLQDLNKSGCCIWPLVQNLFKENLKLCLRSNNCEDCKKFVLGLLSALQLDDGFIGTFLCTLLDLIKIKVRYPEDLQNWLISIVETLERQYPEQFDKEVYKILSSTQGGKINSRKKRLQKIFKDAMTLKGKFAVFDKLYHPNPEFRSQAVKYLVENFDKLRDGEKEMIRSSFIDRLNDNDIKVVKDTLSLIKSTSILNTPALQSVLIGLAKRCLFEMSTHKNPIFYTELTDDVLKLLCEISRPDDWEAFIVIYPYLYPGEDDAWHVSQQIAGTDFIRNNPVFKKSLIIGKNSLLAASDSAEFGNLIVDRLRTDDLDVIKDFLITIKRIPIHDRDCFHKFVVMLILSAMVPYNCPIELGAEVATLFIDYFKSSDVLIQKSQASLALHLKAARNGKIDLEAFLYTLKNVISKVSKPAESLSARDFYEDNDFNQYLTRVVEVCFNPIPNYNKYMRYIADHFSILTGIVKDSERSILLLLNLCISKNANLTEFFILNCFPLIGSHVLTFADTTPLMALDRLLIPYCMVLLLNDSPRVRHGTIKLLEELVEDCSDTETSSYYVMVRQLLDQSDEIILDVDQVPLVVSNAILTSEDSTKIIEVRNALIKLASGESVPNYVKAGILSLLSHVNDIEIFESTSLDASKIVNSVGENADPFKSAIISWNVLRCDKALSADIKLGSNVWKFIENCLRNDKAIVITQNGKLSSPAVLLMSHLDRDFFHYLSDEVMVNLLDLMIERATLSKDVEVLPAASHIFKHIDLDATLILDHFVKMRDVHSPKLDPNRLRRRVIIVPTVDILDTPEWKRGLTVLEFIQDKKKIRNPGVLIAVMFEILKKCLEFDEQTAVEYPKQLILSSILHFCTKLDVGTLPENTFNVEAVVQCIRASLNPQTHHHALLVLAELAIIIPDQVLHHVMAIFTFMGSSVLRHDDAYSFQIILRIIDTVIPILVKDGSANAIANVLRVFVSAILDVPEHRRLPLYSQLLTKINARLNLSVFLLLVFESQVTNTGLSAEEAKSRLSVTRGLCREFSPEIVITACINMLKYLNELPDSLWSEDCHEMLSMRGLIIYLKSPKQYRHFKYVLTTFIPQLLGSSEFVTQVASLDNDRAYGLEKLHKDMIIIIMCYIQRLDKVHEEFASYSHGDYWKSLLHNCYDILDKVNGLLTPQMFLLVVKGLTLHNFPTVRLRALTILNGKLRHESKFFSTCEKEEIYTLIPPLIAIVKTISDVELDEEAEAIVQTALLSVQLLVRLLIPGHEMKFKEILDFMTERMKVAPNDSGVSASLILCVAEICANLKVHAIESLPLIMAPLLKILKFQRSQDEPRVVLISVATALEKIIGVLPNFIAPYLVKIISETAHVFAKWQNGVEEDQQATITKFTSIRKLLGGSIEPRVLIPAILQSYGELIGKKAFKAIGSLMDVLREHLGQLKSAQIEANAEELRNFFVKALEFRDDALTTFDETNTVECQVVKASTTLALKLTESGFKPFYANLYSWAVDTGEKSERVLTFYQVSSQMAQSLKSLFVIFAGITVSNAAEMLDACNNTKSETLHFEGDEDEEKNVMLLEGVLKTLLAIFTHDTHKFVTRDRFKILMQPLVDQLENTVGGIEALVERNMRLITPCIVMFTVATADDSLWKEMNYQILLKMRNSSADIRLNALHCIAEIVGKIGDDFLPLLPETVTFLNELMEDEDESVEKACRLAVQQMGVVLGESLYKYFT